MVPGTVGDNSIVYLMSIAWLAKIWELWCRSISFEIIFYLMSHHMFPCSYPHEIKCLLPSTCVHGLIAVKHERSIVRFCLIGISFEFISHHLSPCPHRHEVELLVFSTGVHGLTVVELETTLLQFHFIPLHFISFTSLSSPA